MSHGDIKSENVLVTSWNWVYVSDFAVHKPTFLPLDDPSDFSYFFDTAGRRTCYLAPERFYTASANPDISTKKARAAAAEDAGTAGRRDGKVTEAMDVFGAGCVLAELFLEGAPLFTLAQLFKYREGDLSVEAHLAAIEDSGVRVSHTISSYACLSLSTPEVGSDSANDHIGPCSTAVIRPPLTQLARNCLPRVLLLIPSQLLIYPQRST